MIAIASLPVLALPLAYSAIIVPLPPREQAGTPLAMIAIAVVASFSRPLRPLIIFLSRFSTMRYFCWRVRSTLNLANSLDGVEYEQPRQRRAPRIGETGAVLVPDTPREIPAVCRLPVAEESGLTVARSFWYLIAMFWRTAKPGISPKAPQPKWRWRALSQWIEDLT